MSGVTAKARTALSWPRSLTGAWPGCSALHTQIPPPRPPATTCLPSGVTARVTASSQPARSTAVREPAVSQYRTAPRIATAMWLPSWEAATATLPCAAPSSRRSSAPCRSVTRTIGSDPPVTTCPPSLTVMLSTRRWPLGQLPVPGGWMTTSWPVSMLTTVSPRGETAVSATRLGYGTEDGAADEAAAGSLSQTTVLRWSLETT
nr:hypothetical protein [Parafrankia sp. EUN1f]